jgi:predicted nucleic acid-binding protein
MIVIADSSPVNYLVQIEEIHILAPLYGTVIVPPAVNSELCSIHAPRKLREWIASPPCMAHCLTADPGS